MDLISLRSRDSDTSDFVKAPVLTPGFQLKGITFIYLVIIQLKITKMCERTNRYISVNYRHCKFVSKKDTNK